MIGGTAGSQAMEEAGLEFRVTMDLDIVLCIEILDADYVRVFWDFNRAGRYQNKKVPEKTLFLIYIESLPAFYVNCGAFR